MVLAFSGQKDAYADYLERLNQYVAKEYEQNGCLSEVKATEYHRISLTMLALGGDPTSIEASDGTVIDLVADGTWNFAGDSPGLQGANGLAYALLTLDAKKYEPSKDAGEIRQKLVEELLDYQLESGAFCLDRSLGGDVDITAMALQALAPYQETPKVQEAVERALSWLSGQLTEDAGFLCYGEGSAESSAQVILALCALGIDPEQDIDFQKNGKTMLDGLKQYRRKDGTYQHTAEDEEENIMATYQSLLALEAVQRLENGKGWIFDFTAYEPPEGMTERN